MIRNDHVLMLAIVALTGCGFDGRAASPGDADQEPDGSPRDGHGGSEDGHTASVCPWPYTPAYEDPCAGGAPGVNAPLELTEDAVYNTMTGVLLVDGNVVPAPVSTTAAGVRTIITERFEIGAGITFRAVGELPLRIVSTSDIVIAGALDVSSRWDDSGYAIGAGASLDPARCTTPAEPGQTCVQHGGSGGGGGGFGAMGGTGGEGGNTRDCDPGDPVVDGLPGGDGGAVVTLPPPFQAGCAGASGAPTNNAASRAGIGAPGGGAVHLMARDTISVGATAVVNAGGAGGRPGTNERAGAGGGGSGGLIVLEAQTVAIMAGGTLAANGGGGGGGCGDAGDAGTAGSDAEPTVVAASGGEGGGTKGGAGGLGGVAGSVRGGNGLGPERGGGGGGGAAGAIRLLAPATMTVGAVITPAPL